MTDSLTGQVALVTGAGRGIGRVLAVGLAAAGMQVGLIGRSPETLDEAVRECGETSAGARAVAIRADVARPDDVRLAVAGVERALGPIDLLVNNAGRGDDHEQAPWEGDPDEWWDVVETNLRGPMLLCYAVIPGMISRGHGRVININSRFGMQGSPVYSAYSVSKAGLARLTECLAEAMEGPGLAAFDLSPGLVHTDMTKDLAIFAVVPEHAWTPASATVEAVLTLASGRADALSGRFLHAATDNLDDLIARAPEIRDREARTLRLRPYGPDDPLA